MPEITINIVIAGPSPICNGAGMADDPQLLPDGTYPFADSEYPLADMAMAEAPAELEAFLKKAARDCGIEIMRDVPVELVCRTPDGTDPKFMVWWPYGSERLHILTPKSLIRGRA